MPTLRIQFPEKDSPSTLVLDAPKITVGRRADNTVQIVDRTISAFHAELIREEDHYRLHDLGSTNGTRVNGEPVTDYHLRETCKISFGPVECEFSPEAAPAGVAEALPTRVEVDAVRRENEDLRAKMGNMQQELEALRTMSAGEGGPNLMQEEMQRLIRERADLQEAAQKKEREFTSLKTELARMNRDRQNLQDALSQAQAEIAHLKSLADEKPEEPKAAEPVQPAKPAQLPKPPGLSSLPKPTSVAAAEKTPQVPPTPSSPSAPSTVPRPVARPAVAATGKAPTPRVLAQPTATPRAVASSQNTSGPSGTQKIAMPAQARGSAGA